MLITLLPSLPMIQQSCQCTSLKKKSLIWRHSNLLQYSCLENPHGQRNLVGYSPWGCKELDVTERLSTHSHQDWRGINSYILQPSYRCSYFITMPTELSLFSLLKSACYPTKRNFEGRFVQQVKCQQPRNPLAIQWLRLHASTAGVMGSIPGGGS